jgi:hypothetical protein
MNKNQKGFAIIEVFIVVAVIAVLLGVGWFVWSKKSSKTTSSSNPISAIIEKTTEKDDPPKLKNIGFNLDYYDATTNRAGDFHFTPALAKVLSSDSIYQKLIWSDYGIQDNRSPNDPTKRNVQPTFRLPLGTKVLAPIDGEVTRVETLYSKDYSIWFARNKDATWSYEMEHVNNPTVKVGDKVKAGQVVAEVSTHGSEHHPGFGIVEIGLFHPVNNEPTHWCPFVHFDDSVKEEMNKKILSLYTSWENYMNDDSIYNNANYPTPGCATLEPSKG